MKHLILLIENASLTQSNVVKINDTVQMTTNASALTVIFWILKETVFQCVILHLTKSMIHQEEDVYVHQDMSLTMINHVFQEVQFVWHQITNIMMIGKSHVFVILGMWWIWTMENVMNKVKLVSKAYILYWIHKRTNVNAQWDLN